MEIPEGHTAEGKPHAGKINMMLTSMSNKGRQLGCCVRSVCMAVSVSHMLVFTAFTCGVAAIPYRIQASKS
jgi:hypothetical protein